MIENDRRVRIISGHYGSGKTEFAVNYAVKLAQLGEKPVLADIDIINPYFRSRERADELAKLGIKLIGSSINAPAIDVPAVTSEVYGVFDNRSIPAVIDVGGDRAGTDVLRRFSDHFKHPEEYDLFLVVNAYRPGTRTPEGVLQYIDSIEDSCGLKVSGLINTTHMLKSTTVSDLKTGEALALEVSRRTGIPLRYNAGLEGLSDEIPESMMSNFFPLRLYMRDDWMS